MNITNNAEFLSGGGEMGALMRSMDWSKTALGPVGTWPQSLRTTVSLCLSSTFPILIAWGEDLVQIYNDSYRPICGAKHPGSMGQNFKVCWETALPVVGDAFDRGLAGEGTYIKDQQMLLDRFGYIEEAFMTFSFAPIRDESGQVGGIFHPITETTDKMLSARRTQVLRNVAALITEAKSMEQISAQLLASQPEYALDIPFIQIYQLSESRHIAKLLGSAGIASGGEAIHAAEIFLDDERADTWPLKQVLETMQPLTVEELGSRFGDFRSGPFDMQPETAMVFPIQIAGQGSAFGFLVAGVSSARKVDQDYANFFELLANTVNTAFSNVHAYQQEQKRAQELAEIDRAKTAFFSNVSHEFRTPLTLIMGPLQEILSQQSVQESALQAPLESVHRNAMRLLKLVNNLLDFSRMEAGRVKATYRKVDLAALTHDLASNFRSIIERTGMELSIDSPKLSGEAYVDTEMWEKIVLNLLSNAFKYTLEGYIAVKLREEDGDIILTVTDTGVGIPESELPHMFERFHRVENSAGRTHEGTGIGLSLVNELVRLHHGTIGVTSTVGEGSTFTITIPEGKEHLDPQQIVVAPVEAETDFAKGAYLKEAISLIDDNGGMTAESDLEDSEHYIPVQKDVRLLLVDDNADMRQYLFRLLSGYFDVEVAINGADALTKLHENRPDVVVSDIMMPVMDGIEMLGIIRKEFLLDHIPVIFLSARAGEEAHHDGIEAGADDYLVKPFSSRELLAKVNAQVKINRSRRLADTQLHESQHRFKMLANNIPHLVWTVDAADQMDSYNEYFQYFSGLGDEQIRAEGLSQFIHPDDLESSETAWRRCLDTATNFTFEHRFKRFDGAYRWHLTRATPRKNHDGEVQLWIGTSTDIHDQKTIEEHLERHVALRTTELKELNTKLLATNRELEQFAFVSSHDLQEPLRKIQIFADLISKELPDPGQRVSQYLSRINASANRMSLLVGDLLTYSRVANAEIRFAPVDLNQIIQDILLDFELVVQQKNALVKADNLPVIDAVASQVNQLFYNLIGNALKFSDGQPVIEITSKSLGGGDLLNGIPLRTPHIHITVSDNGIGFDQQHAEQIFTIFQRLHPQTEYPGTGIGLAICKRVIENHHGHISAQSEMGKGTRFDVFLPKIQ